MHESLDELEIRPDSMSWKFGRIQPRTTELAALERMKKNPIDI